MTTASENPPDLLDVLARLMAMDVALYRCGTRMAQAPLQTQAALLHDFFMQNALAPELQAIALQLKSTVQAMSGFTEADEDALSQRCGDRLKKRYSIVY